MIYNTKNIKNIDLKKYKRHFSFGCSFTNYYWPTWADVLQEEMPDAGYVNTAKPGAGNSYILAKLSQAMRYYNIGEDDLVTIMWTTFYRQDSFKEGQWRTPGNIYTQNDIPIDFVVKYLDDTVGFHTRDYTIVDTAMRMLATQPFDSVSMWGVDPGKQDYYGLSQKPEESKDYTGLQVFYKDLNKDILPDLLCRGCEGSWAETFSFKDHEGNPSVDYHPKTKTYYNYLNKIGFNLSSETGQWADQCDERTEAIEERPEHLLHSWFNFV
jgi:hypothetical protein